MAGDEAGPVAAAVGTGEVAVVAAAAGTESAAAGLVGAVVVARTAGTVVLQAEAVPRFLVH